MCFVEATAASSVIQGQTVTYRLDTSAGCAQFAEDLQRGYRLVRSRIVHTERCRCSPGPESYIPSGRALQTIADHLSGKEWDASTLEVVAMIVEDAGYPIADTGEMVDHASTAAADAADAAAGYPVSGTLQEPMPEGEWTISYHGEARHSLIAALREAEHGILDVRTRDGERITGKLVGVSGGGITLTIESDENEDGETWQGEPVDVTFDALAQVFVW